MAGPYFIKLPMPTSVNASKMVGRNSRGGKIIRTKELSDWITLAGIHYRNYIYANGVPDKIKGRVYTEYAFCFNSKMLSRSDCDNRIKYLQDFFEHKFFENDNAVDKGRFERFATSESDSYVLAKISEVPDNRYADPMSMFN